MTGSPNRLAPPSRAVVDPASSTAPQPAIPWSVIFDRIERFRRRVVWSILAFVAGTLVAWAFREAVYGVIVEPVATALQERGEDPRLAFTRLTDPFIVYLSIAMVGGLALAGPAVIGQLWVAATGGRRRLAGLAIMVAATLLFAAGVLFGHQVLLPFVVRYLIGLATDLDQVLTAREYLRFSLRLMVALGISAELPLLSLLLARLGIVTPGRLWRWFPYSVLVAFVLAALITPPDGVSQVLVAVPILALYLLSIGVAALARRRDG